MALKGRFGAVDAMQEALRAGEPCDLVILTQALMRCAARAASSPEAGAQAPASSISR